MTGLIPNTIRSIFRVLIFNHGAVSFIFLFLLHSLPYVNAAHTPAPPPDPFSLVGPKFSGTMVITTVILVGLLFALGFFFVYIRRCTERRLRRNNQEAFATIIGGGSSLRSRRGGRGLDDSIISTFPTFLYSEVKELKIGKECLECAVCLNEFEDDETLRLIPNCSHVFHMDCIDAWLSAHNTCPVCRANLVPQPGETPSSFFPMLNPGGDSGQSDQGSENIQETSQREHGNDEEASDVNLTNQNLPPRSRSIRWKRSGWFPRTQSGVPSLVQPGQDCERFTLRLPVEVRSQLTNPSLNRSKSCVAFPRSRSSRRGFRSGSGGFVVGRNHNFYERFGRRQSGSGKWGLSLAPPLISRTGSVRTARTAGDGGVEVSCMPSNLFRSHSIKCSFEEDGRLGGRSFDRLRPDDRV